MRWWLIISPSGMWTIGPLQASSDDAIKIADAVFYAEGQEPGQRPIRWWWDPNQGRWRPG